MELISRTLTTGQAPQELVDMVRQGMDPEDGGKATDGKLTVAGQEEANDKTRFEKPSRHPT
jgi:hypothetical protein